VTPARLFALAAAAGGLALALAGAVAPAPGSPFVAPVPARDVVARVNGVPLSRAALERLVAREGSGPASAPPPPELALQRLVEEELLVQRAFEVGLVESDRAVRKALVRAALDAAADAARSAPPDEAVLRAFHAANAGLFVRPRRARVRAIRFARGANGAGADTALRRAEEAARAIRSGLAFEEAARRFGDAPGLPLPDALLPEAALRRQLGPTLAEAALTLPPGGVSPPLSVAGDAVLLQLAELEPAAPAPFEAVRGEVAAAYARRADEEAAAALLARLRARARIELADEEPVP